ncbi:MAG: class I SAM-dependent methyltransferase [Candidatus Melainabacteria bacterium]|nr:class I SAM-dependent methyltransferase [Candidatus Melainabacteria bacterium]
MHAAFDDIAQRIITLNKLEQRHYLAGQLKKLQLPRGAKILDFGCGTALFAKTIMKMGFQYVGYDIDPGVVEYAASLYKNGTFTHNREQLKDFKPFDLILANCCFHHIADEPIKDELRGFRELLKPNGQFLLMDILLRDDDPHPLRKLFRKLERGAYVRVASEYEDIVRSEFQITKQQTTRSHVFSSKLVPVYNDLVVLHCVPK